MLTEIQLQKKRERKANKRRNINYRPTRMFVRKPEITIAPAPAEIVAPKRESLVKRAAGFIGRLWNRKV